MGVEFIKSMDFIREYQSRRGMVEIAKFTIGAYLEFQLVYIVYIQIVARISTAKNRKEKRQLKRRLNEIANKLIEIVIYKKQCFHYLTDTEKREIEKKERIIKLLTKNEKHAIIKIAVVYNEIEKKETEKKETENLNWLQDLITYFFINTGLNKSEIMGLYLCELNLLIKGIEKHKRDNWIIERTLLFTSMHPTTENCKMVDDILYAKEYQKENVVLAEDNKTTQRQFKNWKNMQRGV